MNDLDRWEDDFDVSILEDEVKKVQKEIDNKCEKKVENEQPKKEVRIITEQTEVLRIKWMGIFFGLLSKLAYKLIFLGVFYLALKVEILRNYILNFYFAHYLFFFMFVLLTIDLIFFLIHFMSDVQDILMDNIYVQTIVKQKEEKVPA